jgi:hypothetical protein
MRLYFNGCSHTYGDDLRQPESQAWPAVLSNTIGCDFLNDAVSGNANDHIMYRTIKNAHEFDKIYIAWTYIERFTRYRADNNYVVNFNSNLTNSLYGNDSNFVNYGKMHYAVWHNDLYSFKLWLQNIIMVQRYLESMKKSYIMVNTSNAGIDRWTSSWPDFVSSVQSLLCFDLMNDDQLYQEHEEIQQSLTQINFDHYIGWNTWWLTKDSFATGATGHYLSQGHEHIAKYILKHDTN